MKICLAFFLVFSLNFYLFASECDLFLHKMVPLDISQYSKLKEDLSSIYHDKITKTYIVVQKSEGRYSLSQYDESGFQALTESYFYYSVPEYFARAQLNYNYTDKETYLFMNLSLRKQDENSRSTFMFGSQVFNIFLDYFAGKFNGIEADWTFGDNLKTFKEEVSRGKSFEAAAKETWTGRQASAAGYTEVQIKEVEYANNNQAVIKSVEAIFRKPDLTKPSAD
ncbi:MAG: hypothetical protein QE271_11830 [Bacteriovoracaceae bacterium]|nr:hypothetical protein [Bacteriovoracaceae bacterium]